MADVAGLTSRMEEHRFGLNIWTTNAEKRFDEHDKKFDQISEDTSRKLALISTELSEKRGFGQAVKLIWGVIISLISIGAFGFISLVYNLMKK